MGRTRIAYFDVDGTLTTGTSLFRFLDYYLSATGHPPQAYQQARQKLKAMTAMGVPREETNRAYFANLAGAHAADVTDLAQEWFKSELAHGGYLNPHAVQALSEHQAAGHVTVLVSGSFPALLDPIAAHLGTDETWCTSPEISHGRYTGQLAAPPVIGHRKADIVLAAASAHRADVGECTGYGDHVSDLPMLETTGNAVVVGGDRELRRTAQVRGWRLLPSAPPAPHLPRSNS
ncbi:HAD family phosphatase [Streptomyces sp. WELS2]|uniref:HAD family hydrolase n=1 Tax=Streptomyces sp. WELS2 TaxID=2749435 RepID=UPI0015EFF93A|nr:HAD-IB family hydrolase [Streptomyces sp. WELS2]